MVSSLGRVRVHVKLGVGDDVLGELAGEDEADGDGERRR